MNKRVMITGYGLINSLGASFKEVWREYLHYKTFVGCREKSYTDIISKKDLGKIYDPSQFFERKEVKRLDRSTQYALISAQEAMHHAGLHEESSSHVGVMFGVAGNGGEQFILENMELLSKRGPKRVSPYYSASAMINAPVAEITLKNGCQGPSSTIVAGEASSLIAIGNSVRMIKNGRIKVMLAGGTQGDISPLAKTAYKTLAHNHVKEKFNLRSGAGAIVLEEESHALKRGARILGEVIGSGMNTCVGDRKNSYKKVIQAALKDAQIEPYEVDFVYLHSGGISECNEAEIQAMEDIFKEHHYFFDSHKEITGNVLATNGVTQTILGLNIMKREEVLPFLNVKNEKQTNRSKMKIGIINTFDMNGHNACLVIKA